MPSKRSHSSQFQFRGDGNKHPSPRKSAQKSYFRQSSSRDRGAQFSVPQTSSKSNSQGTLRSSARINEIRARASQKASEKSGISGSQSDPLNREHRLTRLLKIQERIVPRWFKRTLAHALLLERTQEKCRGNKLRLDLNLLVEIRQKDQ